MRKRKGYAYLNTLEHLVLLWRKSGGNKLYLLLNARTLRGLMYTSCPSYLLKNQKRRKEERAKKKNEGIEEKGN